MANYDNIQPRHTSFGRLGFTVSGLVGHFAAWNDARLTRKSLSKLTDRELADIGLVRGDIDTVAGR